jgi:small conductance mechanosensitive channel
VLRVDGFGDSGIDIKIVGDVKPISQWEVMGGLRLLLKKRFDEADIEIPYPHRVMVHEAKAAGPLMVETVQPGEEWPARRRPEHGAPKPDAANDGKSDDLDRLPDAE